MNMAVVKSVQNVPKIGEEEEQFENFVKERLIKKNKLITDSLKENKRQKDPFKRQIKAEIKVLMEDCVLF